MDATERVPPSIVDFMKELAIYLKDHLAGSVAAIELLDHLIKTHEGTPLAASIHARGLKFGIHILQGIPNVREALAVMSALSGLAQAMRVREQLVDALAEALYVARRHQDHAVAGRRSLLGPGLAAAADRRHPAGPRLDAAGAEGLPGLALIHI